MADTANKTVALRGATKDLDVEAVLARNAQVLRRFSDEVAKLLDKVDDLSSDVAAMRREMQKLRSDVDEKLDPLRREMGKANTLYVANDRLLRQVYGLLECELQRRLDADDRRFHEPPPSGRLGIHVWENRIDPSAALLDDHTLNDYPTDDTPPPIAKMPTKK